MTIITRDQPVPLFQRDGHFGPDSGKPMVPEPIVSLEKASKAYGSFVALHEMDLSIVEGEFVTLLGPSGCGKTTTLRLIGGFETPDSGRVRIAGEDVTDWAPSKRAVNTVFQDYALFPHMTVAENIGYGLSVRAHRVTKPERDKQVHDALALVGLTDKRDRKPHELSGGQRQRVAMARALIRKPKVLLLDEPLSALDVKLREAMQIELKHLHQKLGITFLMVTHDQSEALLLSDRIVVMKDGHIAQVGGSQDLYDRPASPYVADFIGAANLLEATIAELKGNRAIVRFADGTTLPGRAMSDILTRGAPVTVGIRPERIRISDGPVGIPVILIDQLFQGGVLRLEVRSPAFPRPMFVAIHRTSSDLASALPSPGAKIRIATTSDDDVLVYPRETEQ